MSRLESVIRVLLGVTSLLALQSIRRTCKVERNGALPTSASCFHCSFTLSGSLVHKWPAILEISGFGSPGFCATMSAWLCCRYRMKAKDVSTRYTERGGGTDRFVALGSCCLADRCKCHFFGKQQYDRSGWRVRSFNGDIERCQPHKIVRTTCNMDHVTMPIKGLA